MAAAVHAVLDAPLPVPITQQTQVEFAIIEVPVPVPANPTLWLANELNTAGALGWRAVGVMPFPPSPAIVILQRDK
jgi:hypothetical protein